MMGMIHDIRNSIWKLYSETMVRKPTDLSPAKQKNVQANQEITGSLMKPGLMSLMSRSGKIFLRLSGAFGAAAVVMGAYGAHGFYTRKDVSEERKKAFETANCYHFLHTLALLAVPLTNRPYIVGPLFTVGMTVFCGSCYVFALTDNTKIRKFTPYGGMLLIMAWLFMLL